MSGPASAYAADRPTRAAAWLHWLWRLAVLGALLWIGRELQQRPTALTGGGSTQIAALSQQVSDAQTRLDDIDAALDDVQDALDRIESAVEDDDGGDDDAVGQQAVLRYLAASPAAHRAGTAPVQHWQARGTPSRLQRCTAPSGGAETVSR